MFVKVSGDSEDQVQKRFLGDPLRYQRMTTAELRDAFLIDSIYKPGEVCLTYVDLDRAIVGMAAPLAGKLALPTPDMLKASHFTERREIGILNVGGLGKICVGEAPYSLDNLDCLYVGRGNHKVSFHSDDSKAPAIFYLLSYPAHTSHPTALVRKEDASPTRLGSAAECNQRTISKYIHQEGARSCQLVMGVTHLEPGSAWNTLPPHTHDRRSEIYMYFNLDSSARVFHFMGPGDETRHIVMQNYEAVASPGWSIHAGVGTRSYSFCWGMGGENQDYADMDPVPVECLR